MRILHVVPSYLPAWRYGGPIRSVHGLAKAQSGARHAVEVFTTDVDGPGRLEVPTDRPVAIDGVSVSYFRCGWPRRLYRAPAMAAALGRRVREFDVVHLHSVFLWPTRAAARAAAAAGVPYFVSPRGMLVEGLIRERGALRQRLWIRLVERRTLRRAAGIVLQSELERRELEALGLDLAPTHVVPNGIGQPPPGGGSDPAETASLASSGPLVLFLGRVDRKKGIDRLIEALPLLAEASLVVAGNDEERLIPGMFRLAESLGVGSRVSFPGEVRGAEKARLLAAADVFCLPSSSENFGLAALEAMAAGRPVIVTPEVGLASFSEAREALIVVGREPDELAAAIAALLRDRERAERLGEHARAVAERHFGWPAIAEIMTEIYASR